MWPLFLSISPARWRRVPGFLDVPLLLAAVVLGVAGGVRLAVVHALERGLLVVPDLVHFLLVAVVVLGLAGVAAVL
ncbi:hypothetical protein CTI14_59335, partial [Methylobacterium radiotolerans]